MLTLLLAALLLLLATPAFAQGYFGSVSGTITDPTGAVLPGVHVTLLDQEKGYTFDATSDSEGRYLFRSVAPGLYSVVAELAGFATGKRIDIRVNISQNPTANLSLKVASDSQSVEVKASNQRLDAQDATTGLVVNRTFINDLPLLDRAVMDLTMLTPGVTTADDQCVGCGGTNFVSNGSRNATADVLMDGVTVTNIEPNGGVTEMTYAPSSEAVEEFRVEQSNFSAEYGFSGASVVNMVTRSGTNSFHGEGYDFIRNALADSNWWYNNLNNIPLPAVHRNNFGATLGGPIWRNKTFFFFDYDGTRTSSASVYSAGVPTAAERGGDFGSLCAYYGGSFNAKGQCSNPQGQIWDPYSGTYATYTNPDGTQVNGAVRSAFIPYNNIAEYASPGNSKLKGTVYQLPGGKGNLIDPIAKKLMALFPQPTSGMANATPYYNWISSGAGRSPNDQFDVKIDHRINQKNLVSGKYSQEWNNNTAFNCFGNFADPCAGGPNWGTAHLFTVNDVHTFNATTMLTTAFGVTRGAMRISAYNGKVADPLSTLGLPAYLNTDGFMGVPAIYIGNYTAAPGSSSTNIGGDPYGNYKQGKTTGQLTAALSRVFGPHELKIGFEGRQHMENYIQTNAPNGDFNFGAGGTSACPGYFTDCGGDSMASFLMGQFGASYEIQDQPATEDRQYAIYVQENWKITHTLTLNLGLRHDLTMPRTERHNRQNGFDPTVTSPLIVPGLSLRGGEVFASSGERRVTDTDWSDLQPRFGIAYQLNPMTTVRGGYGIYYSQSRNANNGVMPYGAQGFNQSTSAITTWKSDGATPYLHLSNPFPNGLIQPAGNKLGLMNDVGQGATGPLRSMIATPYEQSWSFSVERQVPWNLFLTALYAGKKGTHLYFSGRNYINHLGPEIESYSNAQINELTTYVNNPFHGIITDPNSSLSAEQLPKYMFEVPYPQFPGGVSTEAWPTADSSYHSLQVMAEKRYSNGMQFLVSYVWSKSIDDSSVPDDNTTWLGSFTSMQDPNKPWLERSLSTFDTPSVFQASYVYDLPVGRGRKYLNKMPYWLDAAVGGWKTNGIWRASSGRPMSFTTWDATPLPTYGTYGSMMRPNMTGKPHRAYGKDSNYINGFFTNPEVFVNPPAYTLGTMPRATALIRTPLSFTSSASMQKIFSLAAIREGMNLELRLEAENALNHPVFGTPDTTVDDPDFGMITYTSNAPRQIQLGAKVTF